MATPRTIRVVAAVIERGGRYLITQRRPSAVLPLLWEFPGGRVEDGESDMAALKREVSHRLGVSVQAGKLMSFVSHPYERYVVELYLYEGRLVEGRTDRRQCERFSLGREQRLRCLFLHACRRSLDEHTARLVVFLIVTAAVQHSSFFPRRLVAVGPPARYVAQRAPVRSVLGRSRFFRKP